MNPLAEALAELIDLGVEGAALVAAIRRLETATYESRIKTLEQAVADAARVEDERLAEVRSRRERDAERKRCERASTDVRGQASESEDVQTEPSRTGAQVVIPSLPSLRSEEVGGGGVGAQGRDQPTDDWPAGKASDHAKLLLEAVNSPWLDPNKSPDLVTTRGRVAAWKRDGASWEHDVLPVVTGLCANRRSPVSSWKFFDAAVSRTIAENRTALQIPAAGQPRATGPPGGLSAQIAAENAEARRRVLSES